MLVPRDQVKDGEKYLVPDHFRVDLGDGDNKEYMGMEFLPLKSKEVLQNLNTSEANILLSLFSVPVQCTVKDGCVYTKILQDDINLKILQIFFTPPEQHEYIADAIEKNDSPQDHKDIMLGYISGLESLFPIQESDEDQDKITQLLDTVYTDIEQIIDVHAETDSKDDTLDKIETRLRNFLLTIPHHVHANITIETDGSLFQLLIEARNYLNKKFLPREENSTDNEWLEEIVEDHMNPPVPSSIKNYDSAVTYLYDGIKYFYEIEGIDGDEEDIERRVDEFYENIQSLIGSLQEGIVTPDQHFDFKQKNDAIYKNFLISVYGEANALDKAIYHYDDFTEIGKRIGLVVMFKFPKDYFRSNDDISAKGLFDKLLEYDESNDEENIKNTLNTLQECSDEQLKDLDSYQLNKLLEMLLDREDYIFAAKIRDIISPKK